MHKTERWVLFPYLAMDYKASEDWLNQQARAGWRVASFDLKGWTVYLLPATGRTSATAWISPERGPETRRATWPSATRRAGDWWKQCAP